MKYLLMILMMFTMSCGRTAYVSPFETPVHADAPHDNSESEDEDYDDDESPPGEKCWGLCRDEDSDDDSSAEKKKGKKEKNR